MTSHALAHLLLKHPDLPVIAAGCDCSEEVHGLSLMRSPSSLEPTQIILRRRSGHDCYEHDRLEGLT